MTFAIPTAVVSRRLLLQGAGAATLAGCSNLIGPPAAPQIYVLHPAFAPVSTASNVPWQLVIPVPTAPESLDTERIALERAPNSMDYYANSQWTDRVPALLQSLLVEAFEQSGRINAVGRESAGIRADYLLQADIRDFSAHYAVIDTPPKVRVDLGVKILGALNREVIGSALFADEALAAANDMASITAAFSQAAGTVISRIVSWALQVPASHPSR